MPWGTITAETILNAVITYFWPHAV